MKNNKSLLAIIPIIVVIVFLFFVRGTNDPIYIYRPSMKDDCFNTRSKVNDKLDLTNTVKDYKLVKSDSFRVNEYAKTSCISVSNVVKKEIMVVKEHKIEHIKGINNQNYQLSYQEILNMFKNNKDIDKKIIDAVSFFINDESTSAFVVDKTGILQNNAKLAGPDINDASGTYIASINLELAKNDIYEMKSNKKVLKDTKYIFTGLSTTFIKEEK